MDNLQITKNLLTPMQKRSQCVTEINQKVNLGYEGLSFLMKNVS